MSMAEAILPRDTWILVRDQLPFSDSHPGRLFHRRQVWFLLQTAIIACSESCPEMDRVELLKNVGLAALMTSDVLQQVERTHMPEIDEAPDTNQWVATAMMALMDQRVANEMICRAIYFWMESQDDPAIQKKMQELNLTESLDDYFMKAHGLTLRDFVLILVRIYKVFLHGAKSDPPDIQLLQPSIMEEKRITIDQFTKAFAIAGITPEKLAPFLLASRQSWATDFSPMRTKPLLEVFEGKFMCPDANVLCSFFMDGIYDLLQKIVPNDSFRQLFGALFERYINTVFEDFLNVAPPLARRFAKSPKYVGEKNNDQAGDGIILMPEMIVLMEYKGGMLTRRQKYATDIRDTIAGIEGLLARTGNKTKKGIGQLVDNIERIINGEKVRVADSVLDISETCKIVPALIVNDDSLTLHAIRNHVEEKLLTEVRKRKLPEQRIGPLCLFSLRDVESIQDYSSGVSVETIFRDYCAYLAEGRKDVTGSFHGFIIQKFRGKQKCQCFVQAKTQQLLESVIKEMEA